MSLKSHEDSWLSRLDGISYKKETGLLPVLDVTSSHNSVTAINKFHSDLDRDELAELLILRDEFSKIYEILSRELSHNREFLSICSIIIRDYSSLNELRRMLLGQASRDEVLTILSEISHISSYPKVREIERKQMKKGKKYLFVNNYKKSNTFNKNQSKLENFMNNRRKKYREFRFKVRKDGEYLNNGSRKLVEKVLEDLEFTFTPKLQDYLDELIQEALNRYPKIAIKSQLSTVKVKSYDSILSKMKRKDYFFDELSDLIRGRIIVADLKSMEMIARVIEDNSSMEILEKDNKFIDTNKRSPYRALHYMIKINSKYVFELQVKTFPELILSELEHDVVKEDIYNFPKGVKDRLTAHYWGLQKKLILKYISAPEDKK